MRIRRRGCRFGVLIVVAITALGGMGETAYATEDATEAARQLIISEHVEDVFDPLPNPNARLVKHKQSGMFCLFAAGTTARLQVFDGHAKRGDDVGCIQKQTNGAEVAMFAMRNPGASPAEMVTSMTKSMNNWTGWGKPPSADAHPEIKSQEATTAAWPRSATSFRGDLNGHPTFVRLAAAATPDGWLVQERLVVPLDAKGGDPERLKAEAHIMGETIFSETLRVMAAERQ